MAREPRLWKGQVKEKTSKDHTNFHSQLVYLDKSKLNKTSELLDIYAECIECVLSTFSLWNILSTYHFKNECALQFGFYNTKKSG